jgi:hypothetical protein
MANPHRGEVELKAGEDVYTLVYSINALCEAEEATGVNILGDLSKLSTLRVMLWAGLQTKHPGTTRKQAGDIIEAAGVLQAQEAVAEGVRRGIPKKDKTENPR